MMNEKQPARDRWAARLYASHRLPDEPTMEQIKQVAIPLFESPLTSIEAAELVLGRRIDSKEMNVAMLVYPAYSPEDKFTLLAMMKPGDIQKRGM